jgi:hypothetical protein
MFLPRSKFNYMERTPRDEHSRGAKGKDNAGAKPERAVYQVRTMMGLITSSSSATGQAPRTPLPTQSRDLDFLKPKSPPGSGEKTKQEIDAQVSERDASNSPPVSVAKKMPEVMDRDRSADKRTQRHGHETSHELHGTRFKIPECFNYAGLRPI